MKYYKLINRPEEEDYPDLEIGKIYPEDFEDWGYGNGSIMAAAELYKEDWQEVPASEYWLQESELPEEYVVECQTREETKEVANFIKKDKTSWMHYKYVYKSNIYDVRCILYDGIRKDVEHLPIFTYQQWKQLKNSKEFVLPEKWYIQSNNEIDKILCDWRGGGHISRSDMAALLSNRTWVKTIYLKTDYSEYKEITFDQFKKYVLNQQDMSKEIIGYKLKEDCKQYKEAALKISNTTANWENSLMSYDIDIQQTGYVKKLKEAGVLNLWFEPVFSIKEKEYELSNGKFIKINKEFIIAEGSKIDIKYLRNLLNISTFGDTSWGLKITTFDIGCYRNLLRKDFEQIVKISEEM